MQNPVAEQREIDIAAAEGNADAAALHVIAFLERGGEVFSLPLMPGHSTTGLVERIKERFAPETAANRDAAQPSALANDGDATSAPSASFPTQNKSA